MASIGWSMSDARGVSDEFQQILQRVRHPERAFNKMLNEVAKRQSAWFASEGGAWAPRRGRYAAYMLKHYPERQILHGPDRKNHTGGQLREELTKRPFGVEKIHSKGFTYGTDLPYAKVHQQGLNGLPRRRPLKPVDAATVALFMKILNQHVTVSRSRFQARGATGFTRGSFTTSGGMLSKGRRGR